MAEKMEFQLVGLWDTQLGLLSERRTVEMRDAEWVTGVVV
jgi:hypothetical protein